MKKKNKCRYHGASKGKDTEECLNKGKGTSSGKRKAATTS